MPSRAFLKKLSRDQIKGRIGILFIIMLLYAVLIGASGFTFVGPILLAPPLTIALCRIFLGITAEVEPQIGDLFKGFDVFVNSIILYIKIGVFTFLWSMLFIVPGVIKFLSYSMSYYIMAENPDMNSKDALDASIRMTKGHKGELFVLYLSFIPWGLLCMVTFGIAVIYVWPYIQTTLANYYIELSKD